MLIGGLRSNMTALVIGAAIFVTAFAALVYNQLDSWDLPLRPTESDSGFDSVSWPQSDTGTDIDIDTVPDATATKEETPQIDVDATPSDAQLRKFWFEKLFAPSIKPDTPSFTPYGAWKYDIPRDPIFTNSLGEDLCIIDLESRPFDEAGELFGSELMSNDRPDRISGLSLGNLNHWLYAKIHGYKYYYVHTESFADRRDSWKKPPVISKILKNHKTCLYMDSDAIFNYLDLPFEWLMNYWSIDSSNTSLTLAVDPDRPYNKDDKGNILLNTGFIVAHNNPTTYDIMNAWESCPEPDSKYPNCTQFRGRVNGRSSDQGAFGYHIRYEFPDAIKSLSCSDANGFPESLEGCEGRFIRHVWTGKGTWLKAFVVQQMPGPYLEMFHREYQEDKANFYITESQLMSS